MLTSAGCSGTSETGLRMPEGLACLSAMGAGRIHTEPDHVS